MDEIMAMTAQHILFKSVRITDAESSFNGQEVDVWIEEGIIQDIGPRLKPSEPYQTVDATCISPVWVDAWNHGAAPKEEHRQSVADWHEDALAAGLGLVQVSAADHNPAHEVSAWEGLRNHYAQGPVVCIPLASLSRDHSGEDFSDLLSLAEAGACGFSDGPNHVVRPERLELALRYLSVQTKAVWTSLQKPMPQKPVHEGQIHLELGVKGSPAWEEEQALQQAIALVQASGGSLVVPVLSVPAEHVRSRNLVLGTSALHLAFDEHALMGFETRYKQWPVLRSAKDREALVQACVNGHIRFICSNHRPWHPDEKDLEFPAAAFGASQMEGFSLGAWTLLKEYMEPGSFVRLLHKGPLEAMQKQTSKIEVGEKAFFTLWNPEGKSRVNKPLSPWFGMDLQGKIEGVFFPDKGFIPSKNEVEDKS